MAKTESTAVNALISNLQSQKPLRMDPSEDLLFKSPAPVAVPVERRARPRTAPAVKDVPSIPRAANGTAEHNAVRMSAPQPRGSSIPPLPKAAQSRSGIPLPQSRSGIPLPRASAPISVPASNPNITLPPLPTSLLKVEAERPATKSVPPATRSLPPPRPSGAMQAQGTPPPELVARPTPPRTLPPPSAPVAAPYDEGRRGVIDDPGLPPAGRTAEARRGGINPKPPVVAQAKPKPTPDAAPTRPLTDMTSNQAWFEHTPIADDLEPSNNTEHVPTQAAATTALLGKLAVPMIGLVMIGIFVGGYVAFSGEGGKSHHNVKPVAAAAPVAAPATDAVAAAVAVTAPAAVAVAAPVAVAAAVPAPAPAPVAAPAPAPAPVAIAATVPVTETAAAPAAAVATRNVQLVDIRIDSQPSGATVMLVDRGKTSFLGTTPMQASLDVARRYDLIFTHDNKPTQIEHLDPRATHHIEVVLGKPTAAPVAIPAVAQPIAQHTEQKKPAQPAIIAPAPQHVVEHKAAPAAPVAAHPAKSDGAVEQDAPAAMVAAPAAGKGTLMISSKPPCEIYIDGAPTGLTTPQRSIALAAGNHKITLISASDPTIKKTVTIGVTAGKPTKVIQDLMK